jgi:hypothetical protein
LPHPSHSSPFFVMCSVWYCCLMLTTLAVSRQTAMKKYSFKYHGNPSGGWLSDICGHTGRRTEGQ